MDKKLKIILSICPDSFNASEEFYLKRMTAFKVNYSEEFLSEFQKEFMNLKSNQNYSFKSICKELSFFAYDSEESELNLLNYLTNFFTNAKYLK